MILIAHRGLTNGPNNDLENQPQQIETILQQGFDCEIDVWFKDNQWFLGHDRPNYSIDFNFLKQAGLWIHAKNLDALYVLGADNSLNFFWHQKDDFTLTSKGYIWTYPGKLLTKNSIMVLPESIDKTLKIIYNLDCVGICSDYIVNIKEKLEG